ncbi:MAG: hypothetical protein ACE5G3_04395 [Gammaproteobacteria bacterium]
MNRKLPLTVICACAAMTLPAQENFAGEIFFDQARVLETEPLYETRADPARVPQCASDKRPHASNDSEILGDPRGIDPSATLAGVMRTDMQLRRTRDSARRCRTVTRTDSAGKIVGYRVRYEYDGRVYESRVARRPTDTIRVRVRLSVGRPDLVTRREWSSAFATVD